MKINKKLICTLLCIVICFLLIGCSGSNEKIKKQSADNLDSAYPGIEQYRGTTLHFATWIDHKRGEGGVPMASFAEKYGIDVEITAIPQYEYVTKLSGMVASGQSPDIIVDNYEFPKLLPLAEDLREISTIDLSDDFWDKTVIDMSTINGKTYMINSANSPWTYRFMCFYNIKLFEDNGFKEPLEYYEEGNWTIDTFMRCASQISNLGSDYIGASVRHSFASAIFGTQITNFVNGRFVNNTSDLNLSSAYKWMLQGAESGYFITDSGLDQFIKNKCGLLLYGDFGLRATGGMETMDADLIGYVPLPKVSQEQENYRSVASWRAYGICKGSQNAAAAGYFIRYFLDFDNYAIDEMFKSERAYEFYNELRKMESTIDMYTYYGLDISDANDFAIVVDGTSAQVDTNLKALSNQIETKVEQGNKIIDSLD